MNRSTKRTKKGDAPWRGIVKVQRSIVTTHDKPQVVIYNKSRSIFHQQDMPASLKRWFDKDEFKFFATASFRKGKLKIEYRTGWQSW